MWNSSAFRIAQIGYLAGDWLTMGMVLSLPLILSAFGRWSRPGRHRHPSGHESLKAKIVRPIDRSADPRLDYMAICLFDNEYGYYMTRDPFGRNGDFTTAPEISQMFGELIGAWLVLSWRALGRPEQPVFAEIGPGRGTLAKDVARTFDRLEPSLRAKAGLYHHRMRPVPGALVRRKPCRHAGGVFDWINGIDELPRGRPLLIVGNEFFDAVPVRQYVKTPRAGANACVDMATRTRS